MTEPYTLASLMPQPTPPRRPRWLVPVLVAAGVVVIVLLGATAWALTREKPVAPEAVQVTTPVAVVTPAATLPSLLNISGSFDLIDDDEHWKVGQDCEGTGGYSDIDIGTQVIVSSGGETLGKGLLLGGTARKVGAHVGCGYQFLVFGVPAGRSFYKLEVGHRGGLEYSEREITQELALSLGGN